MILVEKIQIIIIPIEGNITSLYGWRSSPFCRGADFHPGIDISAPYGTEVHATAPGVVIVAGHSGGYGNLVRIQHKYGFISCYGHNSKINVSVGDMVKRGDVISYVGSTGTSTGNHLHYEIRLGETVVNPFPYMNKN